MSVPVLTLAAIVREFSYLDRAEREWVLTRLKFDHDRMVWDPSAFLVEAIRAFKTEVKP